MLAERQRKQRAPRLKRKKRKKFDRSNHRRPSRARGEAHRRWEHH